MSVVLGFNKNHQRSKTFTGCISTRRSDGQLEGTASCFATNDSSVLCSCTLRAQKRPAWPTCRENHRRNRVLGLPLFLRRSFNLVDSDASHACRVAYLSGIQTPHFSFVPVNDKGGVPCRLIVPTI